MENGYFTQKKLFLTGKTKVCSILHAFPESFPNEVVLHMIEIHFQVHGEFDRVQMRSVETNQVQSPNFRL